MSLETILKKLTLATPQKKTPLTTIITLVVPVYNKQNFIEKFIEINFDYNYRSDKVSDIIADLKEYSATLNYPYTTKNNFNILKKNLDKTVSNYQESLFLKVKFNQNPERLYDLIIVKGKLIKRKFVVTVSRANNSRIKKNKTVHRLSGTNSYGNPKNKSNKRKKTSSIKSPLKSSMKRKRQEKL